MAKIKLSYLDTKRGGSTGSPDYNQDYTGYEGYVNPSLVDRNTFESGFLDDARARNQSHWEQLGKSAWNIIPGVIGGVLEGVGALAEIPMMALPGEHNWDNPIMQAGRAIKDKNNSWIGDVYRENEKELFDFQDPAWWFETGQHIIESVGGFAATGLGIGAAARGAGKIAQLAALASKISPNLKIGASAATYAAMEGVMSGAQVFKDVYDTKYTQLNEQFNNGQIDEQTFIQEEERAKKEASLAAAQTVGWNTVLNTALNFTSMGRLLNLTGKTNPVTNQFSRALTSGLTQGKDGLVKTKNAWYDLAKSTILEATQEAAEELVNLNAEKMGQYAGFEALGLIKEQEKRNIFEQIIDNTLSEEGAFSAFAGAVGGAGMRAMQGRDIKGIADYNELASRLNKEIENYKNGTGNSSLGAMSDLVAKVAKYNSIAKSTQHAQDYDDIETHYEQASTVYADHLEHHFKEGTAKIIEDNLNKALTLSPKEAEKQGLFKPDESLYNEPNFYKDAQYTNWRKGVQEQLVNLSKYENEYNKITRSLSNLDEKSKIENPDAYKAQRAVAAGHIKDLVKADLYRANIESGLETFKKAQDSELDPIINKHAIAYTNAEKAKIKEDLLDALENPKNTLNNQHPRVDPIYNAILTDPAYQRIRDNTTKFNKNVEKYDELLNKLNKVNDPSVLKERRDYQEKIEKERRYRQLYKDLVNSTKANQAVQEETKKETKKISTKFPAPLEFSTEVEVSKPNFDFHNSPKPEDIPESKQKQETLPLSLAADEEVPENIPGEGQDMRSKLAARKAKTTTTPTPEAQPESQPEVTNTVSETADAVETEVTPTVSISNIPITTPTPKNTNKQQKAKKETKPREPLSPTIPFSVKRRDLDSNGKLLDHTHPELFINGEIKHGTEIILKIQGNLITKTGKDSYTNHLTIKGDQTIRDENGQIIERFDSSKTTKKKLDADNNKQYNASLVGVFAIVDNKEVYIGNLSVTDIEGKEDRVKLDFIEQVQKDYLNNYILPEQWGTLSEAQKAQYSLYEDNEGTKYAPNYRTKVESKTNGIFKDIMSPEQFETLTDIVGGNNNLRRDSNGYIYEKFTQSSSSDNKVVIYSTLVGSTDKFIDGSFDNRIIYVSKDNENAINIGNNSTRPTHKDNRAAGTGILVRDSNGNEKRVKGVMMKFDQLKLVNRSFYDYIVSNLTLLVLDTTLVRGGNESFLYSNGKPNPKLTPKEQYIIELQKSLELAMNQAPGTATENEKLKTLQLLKNFADHFIHNTVITVDSSYNNSSLKIKHKEISTLIPTDIPEDQKEAFVRDLIEEAIAGSRIKSTTIPKKFVKGFEFKTPYDSSGNFAPTTLYDIEVGNSREDFLCKNLFVSPFRFVYDKDNNPVFHFDTEVSVNIRPNQLAEKEQEDAQQNAEREARQKERDDKEEQERKEQEAKDKSQREAEAREERKGAVDIDDQQAQPASDTTTNNQTDIKSEQPPVASNNRGDTRQRVQRSQSSNRKIGEEQDFSNYPDIENYSINKQVDDVSNFVVPEEESSNIDYYSGFLLYRNVSLENEKRMSPEEQIKLLRYLRNKLLIAYNQVRNYTNPLSEAFTFLNEDLNTSLNEAYDLLDKGVREEGLEERISLLEDVLTQFYPDPNNLNLSSVQKLLERDLAKDYDITDEGKLEPTKKVLKTSVDSSADMDNTNEESDRDIPDNRETLGLEAVFVEIGTTNLAKTASANIKKLLSAIPMQDNKGNDKKWLGLITEYYNPAVLYGELIGLLNTCRDYGEIKTRLEEAANLVPAYKKIITYLDNPANEILRNEFTSLMAQWRIAFKSLNAEEGENGEVSTIRVIDLNRENAATVLLARVKSDLFNNNLDIKDKDGNKINVIEEDTVTESVKVEGSNQVKEYQRLIKRYTKEYVNRIHSIDVGVIGYFQSVLKSSLKKTKNHDPSNEALNQEYKEKLRKIYYGEFDKTNESKTVHDLLNSTNKGDVTSFKEILLLLGFDIEFDDFYNNLFKHYKAIKDDKGNSEYDSPDACIQGIGNFVKAYQTNIEPIDITQVENSKKTDQFEQEKPNYERLAQLMLPDGELFSINVDSFRQGLKSFYSYSKPHFVESERVRLGNDKYRNQVMEVAHTSNNHWLRQLANDVFKKNFVAVKIQSIINKTKKNRDALEVNRQTTHEVIASKINALIPDTKEFTNSIAFPHTHSDKTSVIGYVTRIYQECFPAYTKKEGTTKAVALVANQVLYPELARIYSVIRDLKIRCNTDIVTDEDKITKSILDSEVVKGYNDFNVGNKDPRLVLEEGLAENKTGLLFMISDVFNDAEKYPLLHNYLYEQALVSGTDDTEILKRLFESPTEEDLNTTFLIKIIDPVAKTSEDGDSYTFSDLRSELLNGVDSYIDSIGADLKSYLEDSKMLEGNTLKFIDSNKLKAVSEKFGIPEGKPEFVDAFCRFVATQTLMNDVNYRGITFDIAEAAKPKKTKEATIKATHDNAIKRNAALIAPGTPPVIDGTNIGPDAVFDNSHANIVTLKDVIIDWSEQDPEFFYTLGYKTLLQDNKYVDPRVQEIFSQPLTPESIKLLQHLDKDKKENVFAEAEYVLGGYRKNVSTDAQEIGTLEEGLRALVQAGKLKASEALVPTKKELWQALNQESGEYDGAKIDPKYRGGIWWDLQFGYSTNQAKKAHKLLLAPNKPVYAGKHFTKIGGKMRALFRYNKSSIYYLIPSMTKGLEIDNMRKAMALGNIDRAIFESGVKLGQPSKKTHEIVKDGKILPYKDLAGKFCKKDKDGNIIYQTDENGIATITNGGFDRLDRRNLLIQQEISDEGKKEIRGTQVRRLVFVDLINGIKVNNPFVKIDEEGNEIEETKYIDAEQLRNNFERAQSRMIKAAYAKLADELGITDDGSLKSIQPILSWLIKEAESRGFGYAAVASLKEFESDLNKGNFELGIPLHMHPYMERFEPIITKLIEGSLSDVKVAGTMSVQGSDLGFIPDTQLSNGTLPINWIDKPKDRLGENDIIMPAFIRDAKGDLVNMKYVLDNPNGFPEEMRKVFGYRIPTQGHNSMVAFNIVGFFPVEFPNMIMCSSKRMVAGGWDFDVDKLSVMWHNYKFENNTVTKIPYTVDANNDFVPTGNHEQDVLQSQNYQLDIYHAVLSSEATYVARNTPNGSGGYASIATRVKEIEANSVRNKTNDSVGIAGMSIRNQTNAFQSNKAGKEGVAIFSVWMVNLPIVQKLRIAIQRETRIGNKEANIYGALFSKNGKVHRDLAPLAPSDTYEGKLSLFDPVGISDTRTSFETQSAQSAAVDNAKENELGVLNINMESFDVVGLLSLLGIDSELIGLFTSQPIIKAYIRAKQYHNSILSPSRSFIETKDLINEAFESLGYKKSPEIKQEEIDKPIPFMLEQEDLLHDLNLYHQTTDTYPTNEQLEKDIKKLMSFLYYQRLAQSLRGGLFRTQTIDTKGLGASFSENEEIATKIDKFIDKDNRSFSNEKWAFDIVQPHGYGNVLPVGYGSGTQEKNMLGILYENALKLIPNMVGLKDKNGNNISNFFHTKLVSARTVISETVMYGMDKSLPNSAVLVKALRNYTRNINTTLFLKYLLSKSGTGLSVKDFNRALLYGNDNIVKQLLNIMAKYKDDPVIRANAFLAALQPELATNPKLPSTISFNNAKILEDGAADSISTGWDEMINHPNKEISDLGKLLVLYCYATNASSNSPRSFSKFIPPNYLYKLGAKEFFKVEYDGRLKDNKGFEALVKPFFQNNPSLAPRLVKNLATLNKDIENTNTEFVSGSFINIKITDKRGRLSIYKVPLSFTINLEESGSNYLTPEKVKEKDYEYVIYPAYVRVSSNKRNFLYQRDAPKGGQRAEVVRSYSLVESFDNDVEGNWEIPNKEDIHKPLIADYTENIKTPIMIGENAEVEDTKVINIWAGTFDNAQKGLGENSILSNFAPSPMKLGKPDSQGNITTNDPNPLTYKNVEHYYQTWKSGKFNEEGYKGNGAVKTSERASNEFSDTLMYQAMWYSFTTNTKRREALLRTGDSILTHKGGKDKHWENRFPQLLMDIRSKLQTPNTQQQKTNESTNTGQKAFSERLNESLNSIKEPLTVKSFFTLLKSIKPEGTSIPAPLEVFMNKFMDKYDIPIEVDNTIDAVGRYNNEVHKISINVNKLQSLGLSDVELYNKLLNVLSHEYTHGLTVKSLNGVGLESLSPELLEDLNKSKEKLVGYFNKINATLRKIEVGKDNDINKIAKYLGIPIKNVEGIKPKILKLLEEANKDLTEKIDITAKFIKSIKDNNTFNAAEKKLLQEYYQVLYYTSNIKEISAGLFEFAPQDGKDSSLIRFLKHVHNDNKSDTPKEGTLFSKIYNEFIKIFKALWGFYGDVNTNAEIKEMVAHVFNVASIQSGIKPSTQPDSQFKDMFELTLEALGNEMKTFPDKKYQGRSVPQSQKDNYLNNLRKDYFKIRSAMMLAKANKGIFRFAGWGLGKTTTKFYSDFFNSLGLKVTHKEITGVGNPKNNVLFVSVNGNNPNSKTDRDGTDRVKPFDSNGNLKSGYKEVEMALEAGWTIVMDGVITNYNVGEKELQEYLIKKGYKREIKDNVAYFTKVEVKPTEKPISTDTEPAGKATTEVKYEDVLSSFKTVVDNSVRGNITGEALVTKISNAFNRLTERIEKNKIQVPKDHETKLLAILSNAGIPNTQELFNKVLENAEKVQSYPDVDNYPSQSSNRKDLGESYTIAKDLKELLRSLRIDTKLKEALNYQFNNLRTIKKGISDSSLTREDYIQQYARDILDNVAMFKMIISNNATNEELNYFSNYLKGVNKSIEVFKKDGDIQSLSNDTRIELEDKIIPLIQEIENIQNNRFYKDLIDRAPNEEEIQRIKDSVIVDEEGNVTFKETTEDTNAAKFWTANVSMDSHIINTYIGKVIGNMCNKVAQAAANWSKEFNVVASDYINMYGKDYEKFFESRDDNYGDKATYLIQKYLPKFFSEKRRLFEAGKEGLSNTDDKTAGFRTYQDFMIKNTTLKVSSSMMKYLRQIEYDTLSTTDDGKTLLIEDELAEEKYQAYILERDLHEALLGAGTKEFYDWDFRHNPIEYAQAVSRYLQAKRSGVSEKDLVHYLDTLAKFRGHEYLVQEPNTDWISDKYVELMSLNDGGVAQRYYEFVRDTLLARRNTTAEVYIKENGRPVYIDPYYIPELEVSFKESYNQADNKVKWGLQFLPDVLRKHIAATKYSESRKRFNPATGEQEWLIPIQMFEGRNYRGEENLSKDLTAIMNAFVVSSYTEETRREVEPLLTAAKRSLDNMGQIVKIGNDSREMDKESANKNRRKMAEYVIRHMVYGVVKEEDTKSIFKVTIGEENRKRVKQIKAEINDIYDRVEKGLPVYDPFGQDITPNVNRYIESLREESDRLQSDVTLTSLMDALIDYTRKIGLTINVRSAINDVLYGAYSLSVEANSGAYFNHWQLSKAYKLSVSHYRGQWKSPESNKIAYLMQRLNLRADVSESIYNGLNYINSNAFFSNPSDAVFFATSKLSAGMNDTTTMIAIMLNEDFKVSDDLTIKLWDGYDKEGKWLYADRIEDPLATYNTTAANLSNKIQQLSTYIHGNYNPNMPVAAKYHLVGRLLFIFKSWLPMGILARVEGERYDAHLQKVVKGRYLTLWDMCFDDKKRFSPKNFVKRFHEIFITKKFGGSQVDEENMRRLLMDFAQMAFIGTLSLVAKGYDDDDEDDYKAKIARFCINQNNKLLEDVNFYVNPYNLQSIAKDPVKILPMMTGWLDLFLATERYILGKDVLGLTDYEDLNNRKKSRLKKAIFKTIPFTAGAQGAIEATEEVFPE